MQDNNWVLLAIAVMNAVTAFLAFRTHESQKGQAAAIGLLEKNTNSIKDALVATTAKASFAAGAEQARVTGEIKAADLVKTTDLIQKGQS